MRQYSTIGNHPHACTNCASIVLNRTYVHVAVIELMSFAGLLDVLCEYLESDNEQVRTYINGTLYSVLSLPHLKVCCMGSNHVFGDVFTGGCY
jgi:hypothetical protein